VVANHALLVKTQIGCAELWEIIIFPEETFFKNIKMHLTDGG